MLHFQCLFNLLLNYFTSKSTIGYFVALKLKVLFVILVQFCLSV